MAAAGGGAAGFPPASRVLGGGGARPADGAVQITEIAAEPGTPTAEHGGGGGGSGACRQGTKPAESP